MSIVSMPRSHQQLSVGHRIHRVVLFFIVLFVALSALDWRSVHAAGTEAVITNLSPTPPAGAAINIVGINPAINRLYIGWYNATSVSVYDTATYGLVSTLPTDGNTRCIVSDPTTNDVYVLNTTNVDVFNASGAMVTTIAQGAQFGCVVSTAQNKLYYTTPSNSIASIDLSTNTPATAAYTYPAGQSDVTGMAVVGQSLYATFFDNGSTPAGGNLVGVYDLTATSFPASVSASIPITGAPFQIAANPAANKLYVSTFTTHTLVVIGTTTNTVTNTIPLTGSDEARGVGYLSGTSHVYVSNYNGDVFVVDAASETVLQTIVTSANAFLDVAADTVHDQVFFDAFGSTIPVVGLLPATATPTSTVTNTATNTASVTPTSTVTNTATNTASVTPTSTVTNTATNTASVTPTSTVTNTATATSTSLPTKIDTIGIDRSNIFYLRLHNTAGVSDLSATLNSSGQNLPIVGDWTGAGFDSIGVYNQTNGVFSLRSTITNGAPDTQFTFGNPNDTPLSGRWIASATHDGVGVYRPTNGILYVRNALTTGYSDQAMVLGNPGDQGIAGNWTGVGYDGVGVFRPGGNAFYLVNQVADGIVFGNINFNYGTAGDLAITGDWVAQGHDGVGVFRPSTAKMYLKNQLTSGSSDNAFAYGSSSDLPIAGHWQVTYPPIAIAKTTAPVPNGGSVPGSNQIGG